MKPKKKIDRRKKAKRGEQQGHTRKLREPLPPERVDEQITYEVCDMDVRQFKLTPTDQFEIVQHIELLGLPIHVTEYRLRKYLDGNGKTVLSDVPELKNRPIFGPRILSMISDAWQLLDDRRVDERYIAGSCFMWLPRKAVQWRRLRFVERRS